MVKELDLLFAAKAASIFLVPHGAYLAEPSSLVSIDGQNNEKYSVSEINPLATQAQSVEQAREGSGRRQPLARWDQYHKP